MSPNGNSPATKMELDAAARRLDQKIDSSVHRLAKMIVETQTRIGRIEDRMEGLATRGDVHRIMNAIDSFAKKAESYDRAVVLHGHALVEVQSSLKDHEKRLKTLESSRH